DSLSSFTIVLALMSAFALLALALTATGASAVIACVASARTREFAIRMALGAGRTRVAGSILGYGGLLTIVGLTIGLAAALLAAPMLQNLPTSVRPPDAATIV